MIRAVVICILGMGMLAAGAGWAMSAGVVMLAAFIGLGLVSAILMATF